MKLFKVGSGNQGGYVFILTVILLSGAILTSLAMTYLYSINRSKYHARIKETYKLIGATESAASIVKAAWDKTYAQHQTYTPWDITTGSPGAFTGNFPPVTTCPAGSIEVENPDMPKPYCFTFSGATSTMIGGGVDLEFKLKNQYELKDFNRIERFVAKMDRFFESSAVEEKDFRNIAGLAGSFSGPAFLGPTFFGWLLSERQSLAVQTAPANTSIALSVVPDCKNSPNSNSGCGFCKTNQGVNARSACSTISACPTNWPQCPGPGVTQAVRLSVSSADTF